MKKSLLEGVCTALVTPFDGDKLNISMFHRLLDRQLEAGIRAFVICGTTGESPVLTDPEKRLLFRETKSHVGDDALILAGTGSNCTARAVELSQGAQEDGADGLLVVTPYYNKAEPDGLSAHFTAVARAVTIPLILYNVPSRTGVDLPVSVCRTLAELPNVVGIKEASPDLRKTAHLKAAVPESFTVWSGNDDLILPMLSLGARGVISVASNVVPRQMKAMTDAALSGDRHRAESLFYELLPLMDALFSAVNPIPVKAAMALSGMDCGLCRLPLTALSREKSQLLKQALQPLLAGQTV